MRDLLRRFAAVPLALAAYNAGPGPVAACGCVPPYPETRGYVARILGLLGGMGELGGRNRGREARGVIGGPPIVWAGMAGPVVITYLELPAQAPVRPPSRPAPEGFATREVHDPGGQPRAVPARRRRLPVGRPAGLERRALGRATPRASRPTSSSSTAAPRATGSSSWTPRTRPRSRLFGLLGEFHGIGLGGHALTAALTRARELRPRVWLTTCTLDGPYALANYRARGMRPFRTATLSRRPCSRPPPDGRRCSVTGR